MIITLLRGITVDIDNIPEKFDEIISESFGEYTEETNPDFTYLDKLLYIDQTVKRLHKVNDSYEAVKSLMIDFFEGEVDELGNIPNKEDYLSIEFMERCYERGQQDGRLYSFEFCDDRYDNEKIMKILCRIIKVVMDYEK